MTGDEQPLARRAWLGVEAVHAVVYFAPEARDAFAALGLKGFWMGYFASRAAPLGPVPASVVEATFFGFSPNMVRHAAELARSAVEAADVGGRPLCAAHRALPWPGSPLLDLWHAATVLREHRGDGHVAALVAEGFDGLEAHVLQAVAGGIGRDVLQPNRGWTDDEWSAAEKRLRVRGVLDDRGRAAKAAVEERTDLAAMRPYEHVDVELLCELLEPLRAAILGGGGIPVPNPMGMPGDRAGRA